MLDDRLKGEPISGDELVELLEKEIIAHNNETTEIPSKKIEIPSSSDFLKSSIFDSGASAFCAGMGYTFYRMGGVGVEYFRNLESSNWVDNTSIAVGTSFVYLFSAAFAGVSVYNLVKGIGNFVKGVRLKPEEKKKKDDCEEPSEFSDFI